MGIFQDRPCKSPREMRRWFAAPLKEAVNRISIGIGQKLFKVARCKVDFRKGDDDPGMP